MFLTKNQSTPRPSEHRPVKKFMFYFIFIFYFSEKKKSRLPEFELMSQLNVNQVKEALNKVKLLVLESFNKEVELDFYKDDSFKTNKLYRLMQLEQKLHWIYLNYKTKTTC